MRGWTKLGTVARWSTSILKTATVFFSGKYSFSVLPLQPVIYSPRRTSWFLESVSTTRTMTTLAYNTQQFTNFFPFSPSGAVSDTLRIYYTSLPRVYPWRHARDKMYQALALLSGESLEMKLRFHLGWTWGAWLAHASVFFHHFNMSLVIVSTSLLKVKQL